MRATTSLPANAMNDCCCSQQQQQPSIQRPLRLLIRSDNLLLYHAHICGLSHTVSPWPGGRERAVIIIVTSIGNDARAATTDAAAVAAVETVNAEEDGARMGRLFSQPSAGTTGDCKIVLCICSIGRQLITGF